MVLIASWRNWLLSSWVRDSSLCLRSFWRRRPGSCWRDDGTRGRAGPLLPSKGISDASSTAGASVSSRRKSQSSRLTSEVIRQGQETRARQGIALCPCLGWQGEDVPGQASPHVGSQPALQCGILLGQLLMEWLELNGDQQGCRGSSWWEQVCCRLTCCRWRREFPELSRGSSRNRAVSKTVIVACFVVVLILWWLEQRM